MGLQVGAGVVDPDFCGEVKVLLFNMSASPIRLKAGDRVAQLILEKFNQAPAVEVFQVEKTERGEAGFGSTGLIW